MAAITSITIENFMCISDAVTIPIRPITLLFGKNSSGKSTILKALHYMYEACHGIADPDRTSMGGDYIDLGGFYSLVHRHELDRKIRIRIEFDLDFDESKSLNNILRNVMRSGETLESMWVEAVTGWDAGKARTESFSFGFNGIEWDCYTGTQRPETFPASTVSTVGSNGTQWVSTKNLMHWNINHPFIKSEIRQNIKRALNALTKIYEDERIKTRSEIVLKKLNNIRYLGPLRKMPERNFDPKKTSDESGWADGLEAWNILGRDPTLIETINYYMKDVLQLGCTVNRKESTLKLHDEEHDIDLDPHDVGFGISQVIPILVGVAHTGRLTDPTRGNQPQALRRIFAVENPELHLHPAAQVALGDVFIDGIQRDESGLTFLVETHSEHLLLRLLRRVRETTRRSRHQTTKLEQTGHELTPNDLSVVYVRPTPAGVKFTPLTVTNKGDFDAPWPEGFFEERDSEWY